MEQQKVVVFLRERKQGAGQRPASTGVGINYLEICRRSLESCPEVQQLLAGIQAVMDGSSPHFRSEYRCDSPTEQRWFEMRMNPLATPEDGVVVCHSDMSELSKARSNMSRKLIEAQEKERNRIGRELHDDLNQRLAMLAVELERLEDGPSEVRGRLQELRKSVTEISNDVQALSHELHSSKLQYLGAIGGMKSWCKEFGERQGIQIEFKSTEVETSVAPEIGLCLYRVLQEALHNAAKHSGAKRIEVQLRSDSREIHLVISDLGRGFDLEAGLQGPGLGITSMKERVSLANGTIAIQSRPMRGTNIDVRVPLTSAHASQRSVHSDQSRG